MARIQVFYTAVCACGNTFQRVRTTRTLCDVCRHERLKEYRRNFNNTPKTKQNRREYFQTQAGKEYLARKRARDRLRLEQFPRVHNYEKNAAKLRLKWATDPAYRADMARRRKLWIENNYERFLLRNRQKLTKRRLEKSLNGKVPPELLAVKLTINAIKRHLKQGATA